MKIPYVIDDLLFVLNNSSRTISESLRRLVGSRPLPIQMYWAENRESWQTKRYMMYTVKFL